MRGKGNGQFDLPLSVVITSTNLLVVGERNNARLQVGHNWHIILARDDSAAQFLHPPLPRAEVLIMAIDEATVKFLGGAIIGVNSTCVMRGGVWGFPPFGGQYSNRVQVAPASHAHKGLSCDIVVVCLCVRLTVTVQPSPSWVDRLRQNFQW